MTMLSGAMMCVCVCSFLPGQMSNIMGECEVSTDKLQQQVNEARDRSQRELVELRRQLEEKGVELDNSRLTAKKLQEEVGRANPAL